MLQHEYSSPEQEGISCKDYFNSLDSNEEEPNEANKILASFSKLPLIVRRTIFNKIKDSTGTLNLYLRYGRSIQINKTHNTRTKQKLETNYNWINIFDSFPYRSNSEFTFFLITK